MLLPIVAINLVIQVLHIAGWISYDAEKAAYVISGAYLVAICLEVAQILRGR